ncbi:MAG: carboxynorspermidine decarboxylase [Clostridium sp.]|nr:carboxynorspermidine decarboxylase [Prevotella sp.]MCM1428815.1 carboxynorspermidine decarboxylase [Clostridium sp.]MCM1475190.1 carboxynorspermidine decarboxylase [Muribaculaceae bacterium]
MTLQTPYYIVYEEKLRRNLELIKRVEFLAGVKIIMAFKANALWKTFPIISEYISASTASSLNEMKLSLEYLGNDVHAYCPVYTDTTFPDFLAGCSHITFNSLSQFNKFYPQIEEHNKFVASNGGMRVSAGLRVNPHCSIVETDIYNPCLPGSRFGVEADTLGDKLPEGIEGLHFHALCESDSHDLEKLLNAFEEQFGRYIPDLKWINMGGGHLMTRKGYDIDHLVKLLKDFSSRYPGVQLIMEPGSAFTWQTGDLVTCVLDVVENAGIRTAIIDASFACHMPDCLEMPYRPAITESLPDDDTSGYAYRLGGNSCLSGDYVGDWRFAKPLKAGDKLTLLDMNHYTTVKTNMFNGIQHPSIWLQPLSGTPRLLREYTYEDYRERMD